MTLRLSAWAFVAQWLDIVGPRFVRRFYMNMVKNVNEFERRTSISCDCGETAVGATERDDCQRQSA